MYADFMAKVPPILFPRRQWGAIELSLHGQQESLSQLERRTEALMGNDAFSALRSPATLVIRWFWVKGNGNREIDPWLHESQVIHESNENN